MKNLNLLQLWLQVFMGILALATFHRSAAIRLNPNGGYDIVIGIEDNTVEPMNSKSFLEEIRMGMEEFSRNLWTTTHRRFFINSVDVLVPANWWTVNTEHTATWQTLLGSEIRIAHDVGAPNVVNPNSCGTPGLYVELPDTFFKIPRGGRYGPLGKALVNLWARYRFGVWEEHGIPGDTKFPYFYAHPSLEPKWEATGCSNKEILGTFQDIDGLESPQCDPYGSESPDDNCRFIPSPQNTANSSLMHLHWVDSISEFCDSKTHNHAAPNRQNLFCGHRSVWEVIRESDDYKSTKECLDSVGSPQFRVLKESRSPELYVLLDRGRTSTSSRVLEEVMGALVRFVSTPSLDQINIAVGTYPHANQGKNHFYVKEEVGWAPIRDVIYDVERVFAESNVTEGPMVRDFGLAIQEVAEKIKRRNHLAGTVILVIKRGATPNLFDKISFEQEVIASIKEDSRIKVFAIEAQQGDQAPFINLQSLVRATSGQYHLINETQNVGKKLEKILGAAQEKLEQAGIMNAVSSWTTQKQYTDAHTDIEIPIYDNVNAIQIHLTTHNKMVATNIYLEHISDMGQIGTYELTEKVEWDESSDLSRRNVFTYTIKTPKPGSLWKLTHGCHTDKLTDCRFFLIVTAHINTPTPRLNEIDPYDTEMIFNSQSIDIDVSTSAAEFNFVDMSHQGFKIVPFSIHAKVEMRQQRVLGLDNVTALVRLGGQHDNHLGDWLVPLTDDGKGLPDIAERDGIYSGIFVPPENGLYQISVMASGVSQPGGSPFQDMKIVNHAGSLMQMDQQSFGCKNSSKPRCVSAVPLGSFSRVKDIQRTVAVENAATFKPGKPTRILDLALTPLENYTVLFEFTSPRLLGSDDDPEDFNVYMAPHVDNFIGSTDMTKLIDSSLGRPAGSHVSFTIVLLPQIAIPYFAVEALYRGQKSGPSNVVGVVPSEYGPVVPSPTTTPSPTTVPPTTTDAPSTSPPTTTLGSTTSTEFPWPSTGPTTESPFPTTTDESEESDEPIDPTTVAPTTTESSVSTTGPPLPTTTESIASTTQPPSPTTTESSVSTTQPTSSTPTTTESSVSTTQPPSPTTTESSVSTTQPPSSTTTGSPIPTDDNEGTTGLISSSTTQPTTSPTVSTTDAPVTTTESEGVTGSSTTLSTTVPPSTTTEVNPSSSVATTTEENVSSTSSSTTTENSVTTTTEGSITTSSSTLSPTHTTTETPIVTTTDISSSTTSLTSTTTENEGTTSTSTVTPWPATSTAIPSSPSPSTTEFTTTWSPSTTTDESVTTAVSTTTLSPTTTEITTSSTDNPVSSTSTNSPTTDIPTSTNSPSTEIPTSTNSPSTEIPTSTNSPSTEIPTSTNSPSTENPVTTISPSTQGPTSTNMPSTSTADPPTSTLSPGTSTVTPSSTLSTISTTPEQEIPTNPSELPSTSSSTSEQGETQTTPITQGNSSSASIHSTSTLLSTLLIISVTARRALFC